MCEFNNLNIDTVNAIQKEIVQLYAMESYSYFTIYLPAIQIFISTWAKSYKDIYYSPHYVSVNTGNILITTIRFASLYLLFGSNKTFMTDSQSLGTIHI